MTVKKKFIFIVLTILFSCILIFQYTYAGSSKIGYHIDEVFSYVSANFPTGYAQSISLSDRTWYSGNYFQNALSAASEYRFTLSIPYRNQIPDVHPPFYYILLHIVCSFFPGVFSKWFGIGLNIILTFLTLILVYLLLRNFSVDQIPSLIFTFLYGMTYGTINNILFSRMYVLLTLIVTFTFYHHLMMNRVLTASPNNKFTAKQLFILVCSTALGALTQYYFLIFIFFLALVESLFLIHCQKKDALIQYWISMFVSGIIAVLTFPTMIRHLIKSDRGQGALASVLNFDEYFNDLIEMFKIISHELTNGFLPAVLCILTLLTIFLVIKKKFTLKDVLYNLLYFLPAAFYFVVVSVISPYLDSRYLTPIYAIVFIYAAAGIYICVKYIISNHYSKAVRNAFLAIIMIIYSCISVCRPNDPLIQSRYWITDKIAAIQKYAIDENLLCMYIGGKGPTWRLWDEFPYLMHFDTTYFVDGSNLESDMDPQFSEENKFIVYMDNKTDTEMLVDYLLDQLGDFEISLLFETDYAAAYLIQQ